MTFEQRRRLKQGRIAAYYSQHEAAAALHVSPRTYEKWEQGRSSPKRIETYLKVATLFNIGLDWWLNSDIQDSLTTSQIKNGVKQLSPDDQRALLQIVKSMAKANR